MKIGLVIYGALSNLSGGYLYDRKLVEYLQACGDQVEIISVPWRNYAAHLSDNFSKRLLQMLCKIDVDILLQDELNHPSLFLLNKKLHSCHNAYPVVAIVHHLRCSEDHPKWQSWLYRLVERYFLQNVNGFIFNSLTTQQAVEKLSGKKLPNVVATPAGDRFNIKITEEEIVTRSCVSGALRLIFVGNIIPRKGLHLLVEALAQLPKGVCHLIIVGNQLIDMGYFKGLRKYIRQKGIVEEVEFRGMLDDYELMKEMRKSQLLVVPSSYEGYGIVYLEGMGFGLPAVGTTGGGASEIITHGLNGWLIQPGNVKELASLLQKVADDRVLLQETSLAAHQRYLAQPGWDLTGEKIRKFLKNLVIHG